MRDDGRIATDRCRGAEPPLTLQAAFADPGVVVVTGDKAEQVSDHIGVAGGLDNVVMAPLTKQDENLWMLVMQTPADLPEELRYAVDALADMGGIAIAAAQCSDDLEMSDAQSRPWLEIPPTSSWCWTWTRRWGTSARPCSRLGGTNRRRSPAHR